MITKDILVDGSEYKLTLTDQVLNQVDNLKALYATAAESVSPEISDGHLDGLIQEVFKAVEDKKSEVEKQIKDKDSKISKKKK